MKELLYLVVFTLREMHFGIDVHSDPLLTLNWSFSEFISSMSLNNLVGEGINECVTGTWETLDYGVTSRSAACQHHQNHSMAITHGVCRSWPTVGIPILQASVDRMECSTDTEWKIGDWVTLSLRGIPEPAPPSSKNPPKDDELFSQRQATLQLLKYVATQLGFH